jgi:hypothetical protein
VVDEVIDLDSDTLVALMAAGQPIVAPILARGEVDTGSNMTTVHAAILRQRATQPIRGDRAPSLMAASPV